MRLHLVLALLAAAPVYAQAPGAASAPATAPAPAPATPQVQAAPAPSAPDDDADRRERLRALVDDPSLSPDRAEAERSLGWQAFQTFVVLGLVILLIYLTLNHGLRRLMGIRGPVGRSVVTVIDRVPLDQKKALYVVKVAGEYLLLGGAEGGVQLVTKLDAAEVERLQRDARAATPQLSPFLQKLLSRRGGTPPPTGQE